MRDVTRGMISEFRILELGYDFLGYEKQEGDLLTFHHLLVPRRLCTDELNGYTRDNGAILYTTAHQYLHVVEVYDREIFEILTLEMKNMLDKGYLDTPNLRYIDDVLTYFENEHSSTKTSKGKYIIKESYTNRRKF